MSSSILCAVCDVAEDFIAEQWTAYVNFNNFTCGLQSNKYGHAGRADVLRLRRL